MKCFLQGDKEGGGGGVWFETIVDYEELCNLRTDGRCISLSLVKSENRRNQFHVTQDIALSLSPSSQHPASPSHRPQIAKLSNSYSPVLLCHAAVPGTRHSHQNVSKRAMSTLEIKLQERQFLGPVLVKMV